MTDESFLSRWSRLNRQPVAPAPEPEEPPPEEPTAQLPVAATAEPAEASPEAPPESDDPLKDLPPVEELTLESDFTPFLRAEVPDDLHRQALAKRGTSDPVFANGHGGRGYPRRLARRVTGAA
ncbi:DUF3306 domain-containing protein, partial [Azospirillum brasilense]|nr:DUF3306 domain-containing protein [Azospirillum brasilense]